MYNDGAKSLFALRLALEVFSLPLKAGPDPAVCSRGVTCLAPIK